MVEVDLAIVGTGATGLATAHALASLPLRVALVGPTPSLPKAAQPTYHAFRPQTVDCFERWGLWPTIAPHATPFHRIHVWEAQSEATYTFDATTLGRPTLGHMVATSTYVPTLWEQRPQGPNIVHVDTTVEDLQRSDHGRWRLHTQNRTIDARYVVAADGKHSPTRQRLHHAHQVRHAYHAKAWSVTVTVERPHGGCAYQRILPTGPLALLPLADPYQVHVVWTHTHLDPSDWSLERWGNQLTEAADHRLGTCTPLHLPSSQALTTQWSKPASADRCYALVGDAAHVVHPLAGQGVNLGFADVAMLSDSLQQHVAAGHDLHASDWLTRYADTAWRAHRRLFYGLHALNTCFSHDGPGWTMLRRFGSRLLQRSPTVQQWLIQEALGRGSQP